MGAIQMEQKETVVNRLSREIDSFVQLVRQNKLKAFGVVILLAGLLVYFLPDKMWNAAPTTAAVTTSNSGGKPTQPSTAEVQRVEEATGPHSSDQAADSAGDQDIIATELRRKNLLRKINQAQHRLDLSNISDQEVALHLYIDTVAQLSPEARNRLDQGLLRNAEKDFRAGRNAGAVEKYSALFSRYR